MKVLDLDYLRGDTKAFDVSAQKQDPTIPTIFDTIDLTGAKVWCTIKRNVSDADINAIVQLSTTTSGVTILNAVGGQARVTIPATSMLTLPDNLLDLPYDVQVKEVDGTVTTIQRGILHYSPDVTRSTA